MSAQTLSTPEQIMPTNQNLTTEERRKMKKRLKRENHSTSDEFTFCGRHGSGNRINKI